MRRSPLLLLAVVAAIGLNLRPFLTATGPLAASIAEGTGLDQSGLAFLTVAPMLLMGLCAFGGPALQERIGSRRAILAALAILCLGSALRLFADSGALLLGTAILCGLGVAVIQAVFPAVIKREFPARVAAVTGLYSATLMAGGALGAQFAPILAHASGDWHLGLGAFALPAVAALALAAPFLPRDAAATPAEAPASLLIGRPRTWLLMACFGLVNGGYASIVAWLPAFYQAGGWSPTDSGGLLAVVAIAQGAAALLLPLLAAGRRDRRPLLWLTLAMQGTGFAGLAFAPAALPTVWAMLGGAGLGGCFALTLVAALDHFGDPARAGALSALMQGGGFLIAGLAPWIVALLHERTGGFAAGWLLHLGCVGLVAVLTIRLNPAGYARAVSAVGKPPLRRLGAPAASR